jgi:hypothetical protein
MLCINIYIYDLLLNVVIMTFGSTKIDSNRRSFMHKDASNECVLKKNKYVDLTSLCGWEARTDFTGYHGLYFILNFSVELLALLLRILEVPVHICDRRLAVLTNFPWALEADTGIIPQIRPRPFYFMLFPICHS